LSEKKHSAEMYGEALREIGVLIFVFAPLYQLFEPNRVPWSVFVEVLLSGISFFVIGIIVERKRV
jgi:uncharacterized membrane protein